MDISDQLHATIAQLAQALQQRNWMLATAESCTGGMIAAACTDLPGSSAWFDRGFVTYSNAAKTEMLGVPAELIAKHGAVSEEVVRAMAGGAIAHSGAHVSICTTGIAGPGGATATKPVGTVWLGCQVGTAVHATCLHLNGNRQTVREQATASALRWLLAQLPQDHSA